MAVYENFLQKCFREKVILFPYDGLHSLKSPAYPVNEVFIGIMMAAALFPHEDEEKQFLGYVAQYFADFMKQFEEADTLDLINAKEKIRLLNQLAYFPLLFFGSSHAFCEALLNWKPFSKNGKGSLREKFDQGLFFGDVYQRFLFDKIRYHRQRRWYDIAPLKGAHRGRYDYFSNEYCSIALSSAS